MVHLIATRHHIKVAVLIGLEWTRLQFPIK